MNKILCGRKPPAGFLFATEAPTLDNGLLDNLDGILNKFPETKLIIIDTLQKIRGRALPRESSYEQDYREMGAVKSHMDKKGVSVLFVHHNRKMKDEDDPFNMISGTNGIMGAADTIWAIIKGKRSDNEATLHITGRDVMQSDTIITFDKSTWRWTPVGSADWINAQREKQAYDNDPIVKTIKELLKRGREWKGTASDLMNEGRKICKRPISSSAQALGYPHLWRNLRRSTACCQMQQYSAVLLALTRRRESLSAKAERTERRESLLRVMRRFPLGGGNHSGTIVTLTVLFP